MPIRQNRLKLSLSAACEHIEAIRGQSSSLVNIRLVPETERAKAAFKRAERKPRDDPWTDTLREFLDRRARAAVEEWDAGLGEDDEEGFEREPAPPANKVHSAELFEALGIGMKDQSKLLAGRLRTVMESGLGWKHKKGVRVHSAIKAGYEAQRGHRRHNAR